MMNHNDTSSRRRIIAYWVATLILVTECLVGGVWGALQLQPFIGMRSTLAIQAIS